MKLVTAAQMRALEQSAVEAGGSLEALMEAAGLAVAQEAWMQLGQLEGRRIAVLVGPGNNGGDGLVAARAPGRLGRAGALLRAGPARRRAVDADPSRPASPAAAWPTTTPAWRRCRHC